MCTSDSQDGQGLRIGEIAISGRAILAPMSGVTDLPFRRLAHRFGAGLVVSEMVVCEANTRGSASATPRRKASANTVPARRACRS